LNAIDAAESVPEVPDPEDPDGSPPPVSVPSEPPDVDEHPDNVSAATLSPTTAERAMMRFAPRADMDTSSTYVADATPRVTTC
jgi:hypothetical protein